MDTENLKFKNFSLSDLEKLMELEKSSFSEPKSEFHIKQLYQKYPDDFVVAEFSQEIVGYVLGYKTPKGLGLIKRIAVSPVWRRKGIGTRLIGLAIEKLKKNGVKKVFLNVRTGNAAGALFHQNLGFKEIKTIRNYYKNGDDAFLMGKDI